MRRIRVPVTLRDAAAGLHRFLDAHEIELVDGAPCPFVYEGRRYLFTGTRPAEGFASAAGGRELIYVFSAEDGQ